MAYATASDVKTYLGISASGDDALLTTLIGAAQAWIDNYTSRTFEASADTTRYLDVTEQVEGLTLWLDKDLCAITSVKTNADSASGGTTVTTGDYLTIPKNETPYWGLRIRNTSTLSWDYTDEPELGVAIVGKWVYSTTPPADIKQGCIRLAAYMYRQKDAQVFDVTALPEQGVITVPQGIPADVKMLLEPYRLKVGSYGN